MDIKLVIGIIRGALSDRLITITALFMAFTLAAWAMIDPTWMRCSMAAFFALCVFLPALFKERTKGHDKPNPAPEAQ
jgi:hypothetical protein